MTFDQARAIANSMQKLMHDAADRGDIPLSNVYRESFLRWMEISLAASLKGFFTLPGRPIRS